MRSHFRKIIEDFYPLSLMSNAKDGVKGTKIFKNQTKIFPEKKKTT